MMWTGRCRELSEVKIADRIFDIGTNWRALLFMFLGSWPTKSYLIASLVLRLGGGDNDS
jgi:hypothetical protein